MGDVIIMGRPDSFRDVSAVLIENESPHRSPLKSESTPFVHGDIDNGAASRAAACARTCAPRYGTQLRLIASGRRAPGAGRRAASVPTSSWRPPAAAAGAAATSPSLPNFVFIFDIVFVNMDISQTFWYPVEQ
ncbi:hypothetical protein EVAR_86354_1 [Eumeta japonica]|uniref:Uncharacterized protein n=1 Tax=Eumeta variegata TaxID=151549 RepID=A0A4C1YFS4_EUMVA|nr:hypothetical protein EVAR_86354_1 [Eumeta japonica]